MNKIKSLIRSGAISIFSLFILIVRFAIPILIIIFLFKKCNGGNELKSYIHKEEFEKAAKYGAKHINDFIKDKDTFSIQLYLIAVTALGDNANIKGNYSNAIEHYHRALNINKTTIADKLSRYLTLNNLADVHNKLGNYNLAKSYYTECLNGINDIDELKNEKDAVYFKIVNNLAQTNYHLGNYAQSEEYFLKVINFFKKHNSEYKNEYSTALLNYGLLCYAQGNYKKAESTYLQALELSNKDNASYSNILNGLGATYVKQNKTNQGEKYFIEVLKIRENKYGNNHIDLVKPLNNLSAIYAIHKKYKQCDSLSAKALKIIEKSLGKENYSYAVNLNILGDIKTIRKKHMEAQSMYIKAFNIISKLQSHKLRPEYFAILNNVCSSLNRQGNYMLSAKYYKKGFAPFKDQTINAISYLSNNQMDYYKKTHFKQIDFNLSFLYQHPSKFDFINIGCFETSLLLKSLSLRSQQQIKKNILNSDNKLLKEKYHNYIENKKIIAFQSQKSKKDRIKNLDFLILETETLEKELLKRSSVFANYRNSIDTYWKDIKNKLKPNEAIIDYVAFNYYNKKWTDSIVYAAFIVKKGYQVPQYVYLFEEKQLNELLKKYPDNEEQPDMLYTDPELAERFLAPLKEELKGITTLYLSPSGLGHQINFSALPAFKDRTLGEAYNVHIFGSSAALLNYHATVIKDAPRPEILLYGDIDYDKSPAGSLSKEEKITLPKEFNTLATRSGITQWGYLPGTADEVEEIRTFASTNGFSSNIVSGEKASKKSILELDGREKPFVLHLATHGFFFPDIKKELPDNRGLIAMDNQTDKKNIYRSSEDPMLRSGLLFAGANKYWGKDVKNTDTDNGILTAGEISNLDLSACNLVVLSACDTGLGDIKGSEGVYGLQRAFKMAGVKNIIMSLWKVPDKQTAELFKEFYRLIFEGRSVHEAFRTAQEKMKEKYSPFYWAGFVLLE